MKPVANSGGSYGVNRYGLLFLPLLITSCAESDADRAEKHFAKEYASERSARPFGATCYDGRGDGIALCSDNHARHWVCFNDHFGGTFCLEAKDPLDPPPAPSAVACPVCPSCTGYGVFNVSPPRSAGDNALDDDGTSLRIGKYQNPSQAQK